jgi:translation initiation factor eIF-2B subunit beta
MIQDKELENLCNVFITSIQRKQIKGTYNIGKETTSLLRIIVASYKKTDTVQSMIDACRFFAKRMKQALPTMHVIGNISRRVLFIIRDEYLRHRKTNSSSTLTVVSSQPNLANLLEMSDEIDYTLAVSVDIKAHVIEGINELLNELDGIRTDIGEQAREHIHSNEVILTVGRSHTVEDFLKSAAEKRDFYVIVTEHAPWYDGHEMVQSLTQAGINCTLISDAASYAVMANVSKVIVGTHAVMANGGLIAPSGTHIVALAAKEKSVPFVVCNGIYKLTPLYPLDQDSFNERFNPSEIIDYTEGLHIKGIHAVNPSFDYVPPELIALFITNGGTHNPTYIYRLLAEYYNSQDYNLE